MDTCAARKTWICVLHPTEIWCMDLLKSLNERSALDVPISDSLLSV